MIEQNRCAFCKVEDCLTTLGQYTVCPSCFISFLQAAMDFARRNTMRGSLYHAAFEAACERMEKEPEKLIKEARDA